MTATYSRPDGKNRFQIRSAALGSLPSAWLDQEFNALYGVINGLTISGTVSASEWTNVPGEFTQDSSTTFIVSGNLTSVFEPLRAIQFTDDTEVTTESHIQSSSYTSGTDITTVVVYGAVVPSTISKVDVGLISTSSATIPSVDVKTKTANYTVGAKDQIILADDSLAYTGTMMYDDGALTTDEGYPALLITLPQASVLPNKLLCVKKIAGPYRTIVLSHFNRTTVTESDGDHYNYIYDFQILGDNEAKNRVVLNGIGECLWFVSNGTNWYELSPEATEIEKGLVRFATTEEMTLSAQELEDGEELPRNLAVSPYHADKEFLRTDASNMRFASNYIYKHGETGSVATLQNGTIVIAKGVGVNIPTGRDENGVCTSKKYELTSALVLSTFPGVSANNQLLFLKSDGSLIGIWAKDFYIGYNAPTVLGTQLLDNIIWFDYGANLLKLSTDNGINWTTFDGCGPICEYSGNGSAITNLISYQPVAFLTRDDIGDIYRQVKRDFVYDYASRESRNSGTSYTANKHGLITAQGRKYSSGGYSLNITIDGTTYSYEFTNGNAEIIFPIAPNQTYSASTTGDAFFAFFIPMKGGI